jgi:hypothetical protein
MSRIVHSERDLFETQCGLETVSRVQLGVSNLLIIHWENEGCGPYRVFPVRRSTQEQHESTTVVSADDGMMMMRELSALKILKSCRNEMDLPSRSSRRTCPNYSVHMGTTCASFTSDPDSQSMARTGKIEIAPLRGETAVSWGQMHGSLARGSRVGHRWPR